MKRIGMKLTDGGCPAVIETVMRTAALQSDSGAVITPGRVGTADTLTQCAAVRLFCKCGLFERARAVLDYLAVNSSDGGIDYGTPISRYGQSEHSSNGASVVCSAVILAAACYLRASGDSDAAARYHGLMTRLHECQTSALVNSVLPFCGREMQFEYGFAPIELSGSASFMSTSLYIASAVEYMSLYGDDNGRYTHTLERVRRRFNDVFMIGGRIAASNPAVSAVHGRHTFGRCRWCGREVWMTNNEGIGYICHGCLESRADKPKRRIDADPIEVPEIPCAQLLALRFGLVTAEKVDMRCDINGLTSPIFTALALECADGIRAELLYRRLLDELNGNIWHEYERYGEAFGSDLLASLVCAAAIMS